MRTPSRMAAFVWSKEDPDGDRKLLEFLLRGRDWVWAYCVRCGHDTRECKCIAEEKSC